MCPCRRSDDGEEPSLAFKTGLGVGSVAVGGRDVPRPERFTVLLSVLSVCSCFITAAGGSRRQDAFWETTKEPTAEVRAKRRRRASLCTDQDGGPAAHLLMEL